MDDAGFPTLEQLQEVPTGYTTYYGEEADLVSHRSTLPWRGSPAGGGVASANDMLKFFQALQSGKLLRKGLFAQATTAGPTPWYGMGFVVGPSHFPSWGHGGNSYGMDVAAHHYPKIDTTFICLASRDMVCNRLIQAWYRRMVGPTR
jgi:D-alanyl-D-alanine carboxypeptidase